MCLICSRVPGMQPRVFSADPQADRYDTSLRMEDLSASRHRYRNVPGMQRRAFPADP